MSTRVTSYITQKEIAFDKFRLCDVAKTEVCHFENIFAVGTNERNLKQEFSLALRGFVYYLENSYFYKLQQIINYVIEIYLCVICYQVSIANS